MIWIAAWFEFNARLLAGLLTRERRPEHGADVIDLSELRRRRQAETDFTISDDNIDQTWGR